jgi:hypothetical protein
LEDLKKNVSEKAKDVRVKPKEATGGAVDQPKEATRSVIDRAKDMVGS